MTKEEISFFDRVSETWDDDEVLSTPAKVREILGMLNIKEGDRILDLGTGTGVLLPYLTAKIGKTGKITAVDISEGMLRRARAKFGSVENVEFCLLDFENEEISGEFDYIFLYCVFPHLHSPATTLSRLRDSNLRPGGKIVVAFPSNEEYINNIHREKKAKSDLLPSAPVLASRLNSDGLHAEVLRYDPEAYVVSISRD